MITVQRTITLPCKPEVAFDFLADAGNELQWNPEIVSVEQLSRGAVGLGTKWRGTYKQIGWMDFWISEYRAPSSVQFTGGGPRMDMMVDLSFQPVDGTTRVDFTVSVEPKGIMKIFKPFMCGQMQKGMNLRLSKLTAALPK